MITKKILLFSLLVSLPLFARPTNEYVLNETFQAYTQDQYDIDKKLEEAAWAGDYEKVKKMIESGTTQSAREFALEAAASADYKNLSSPEACARIISALLDTTLSYAAVDHAFLAAAESGSLTIVKYLLDNAEIEINAQIIAYQNALYRKKFDVVGVIDAYSRDKFYWQTLPDVQCYNCAEDYYKLPQTTLVLDLILLISGNFHHGSSVSTFAFDKTYRRAYGDYKDGLCNAISYYTRPYAKRSAYRFP